jgi:hypothetical protein
MNKRLAIIEEKYGERVSPEVRPLLESFYACLEEPSIGLESLVSAIEAVLTFLASPQGRTNANCWAVDLFFCLRDDWKCSWEHLPEELQEILEEMGGALHDTVQCPEIAHRFDSSPEQLLSRLLSFRQKARLS